MAATRLTSKCNSNMKTHTSPNNDDNGLTKTCTFLTPRQARREGGVFFHKSKHCRRTRGVILSIKANFSSIPLELELDVAGQSVYSSYTLHVNSALRFSLSETQANAGEWVRYSYESTRARASANNASVSAQHRRFLLTGHSLYPSCRRSESPSGRAGCVTALH